MNNRMVVVTQLVEGLNRLSKGEEYPFPIPAKSLTAYQDWCITSGRDSYNYTEHFPTFVCAVILGYYDDVIEEWNEYICT